METSTSAAAQQELAKIQTKYELNVDENNNEEPNVEIDRNYDGNVGENYSRPAAGLYWLDNQQDSPQQAPQLLGMVNSQGNDAMGGGYGQEFFPQPMLYHRPQQFYVGQPPLPPQPLFLQQTGNIGYGYGNEPSYTCPNNAIGGQPMPPPQHLRSSPEFAPRGMHPDFLDPNTLAMEFERMYFSSQQSLELQFNPPLTQTQQQNIFSPLMTSSPSMIRPQIPRFGTSTQGPRNIPEGVNSWHEINKSPSNASNGNGSPFQNGSFNMNHHELLEKFKFQQAKYSQLPIEAHNKIQSMPGYEITNVFNITLSRFSCNNLIESPNVFAVFTRRPETGQNWLMAFAFKKDCARSVIKFNRLLTDNLKITVIGQFAIELESSRLSKSYMGEQYIFGCRNQIDTKLFLDTINYGKSQVWTTKATMRQRPASGPNVWLGRHTVTGLTPGEFLRTRNQPHNRYNKRNPPFCDENNAIFKSIQQRIYEENLIANQKKEISNYKNITFSHELTLLINKPGSNNIGFGFEPTADDAEAEEGGRTGLQYSELGTGTLCIVDEDKFDQIIFVMNKVDVVCELQIYAWNKFNFDNQQLEDKIVCSWNGSASFPIGNNKNLPCLRQFRTVFDDKGAANKFKALFLEAKKKASAADIKKYYTF